MFGAEEDSDDANLSGLTSKNSFSSPDGLWFSKATGICWIQTDDGAFTDETNCMMLTAIPGQVGEAKLRCFLVAPPGAEVTGITETPDGRTLFVNIQHPDELSKPLASGASPQSMWPGNAGYGPQGRPRSVTIVITRTDGGVIGL